MFSGTSGAGEQRRHMHPLDSVHLRPGRPGRAGQAVVSCISVAHRRCLSPSTKYQQPDGKKITTTTGNQTWSPSSQPSPNLSSLEVHVVLVLASAPSRMIPLQSTRPSQMYRDWECLVASLGIRRLTGWRLLTRPWPPWDDMASARRRCRSAAILVTKGESGRGGRWILTMGCCNPALCEGWVAPRAYGGRSPASAAWDGEDGGGAEAPQEWVGGRGHRWWGLRGDSAGGRHPPRAWRVAASAAAAAAAWGQAHAPPATR